MGRKEKLIQRLKSKPKDFTFDDAESLLNCLDYIRSNKGKTSGSRVIFSNEKHGDILLHKPHPQKELKAYQIKQLLEIYDETLEFYPIFLCDNKQMQSVVYWRCVKTALDCIVKGKYKNIDDVVFQKNKIGERFLFRVLFEKQEYFIFDTVLMENILRKEAIGFYFQEVKQLI